MDLGRLDHMPTVKLAMTPFPWSIDIDEPLSRARAMMTKHEIHHLPVTDRGALVGVISSDDAAPGRVLPAERDPLLRAFSVRPAYIVDDTAPLDDVLAIMARERLHAALVTRRDKLVGVFTVTDACRLLAEWLRASFPAVDDDDAA